MFIQPYLDFDGRCEEALNFYVKHLGAEITMQMKFDENADAMKAHPQSKGKILHAAFRIGETMLLASDADCAGKPKFEGFSLSITAKTEAEAEKAFAALSDGGQVSMALSTTFFAKKFGQLKDRFGIAWMVMFVG